MEKKQSSVEWLEQELKKLPSVNVLEIFEQAKAMHKEEIEDAWINGTRGQMIAPFGMNRYKPDAEQY